MALGLLAPNFICVKESSTCKFSSNGFGLPTMMAAMTYNTVIENNLIFLLSATYDVTDVFTNHLGRLRTCLYAQLIIIE